MMKVILRIVISIFGKQLAKHAFNSEKEINSDVKSDRFTFSFSICLSIFKKVVEVLVFCSSMGSNSS